MTRADLREWALKGAEQRLVEIAAEAARIYAEFPELREPGRRGSERATTNNEGKPRRRKRRSKEVRQRMAEAQRKRWAAIRANKDGADKQAGAAPKEARKAKKKR